MTASPTSRRARSHLAPVVALLALPLLVSGCAVGDPSEDPSTGAAASQGAQGAGPTRTDAFPVTVDSAYGPTKITQKPKRIVALSPQIADILVSLGIQPVAVATSAQDIAAATPWLKGELTGTLDPELISGSQANIEAIASYRPDLVLGSGYLFDEGTFEQMNHVAPTFAGLTEGNDDWNLTARAIGQLTGTDGKAVVKATQRRCSTARSSLPGLKGKTYQYVVFEQGQFRYGNGSWLECFGLRPHTAQVNSQTTPVTVSMEKINLLDADVLAIFDRNAKKEQLTGDDRFNRLPSSGEGAVVWADLTLAMATNSPGPLSMRYVIKRVTPVLQDAGR